MKKLTGKQILAMQRELIAEFGGSGGIRFEARNSVLSDHFLLHFLLTVG
jgi:hypothetical protein